MGNNGSGFLNGLDADFLVIGAQNARLNTEGYVTSETFFPGR